MFKVIQRAEFRFYGSLQLDLIACDPLNSNVYKTLTLRPGDYVYFMGVGNLKSDLIVRVSKKVLYNKIGVTFTMLYL